MKANSYLWMAAILIATLLFSCTTQAQGNPNACSNKPERVEVFEGKLDEISPNRDTLKFTKDLPPTVATINSSKISVELVVCKNADGTFPTEVTLPDFTTCTPVRIGYANGIMYSITLISGLAYC